MLRVPYRADDTLADRLHDAGRILKYAETCDCPQCLEYRALQTDFAKLARQFYIAPGSLVFRALFEGWGLAKITLEINRCHPAATVE